MTPTGLLWFISGMFGLFVSVILLILWRVERFMVRILAYIKADTVYGAENALSPKEEEKNTVDPITGLRQLQKLAYESK